MTVGIDILLGLGAILICGFIFYKIKIDRPQCVYFTDIPKIFGALKREGKDASFVIFIFAPAQESDQGDGVNIQFSIQQGQIGLDWVLLGQTNVADEQNVRAFIQDRGYALTDEALNNVKYLRVVEGDIAQLCQDIIRDMYRVKENDPLETVVEGIKLPEL